MVDNKSFAFTILCENVNMVKRVVNCCCNLIMLRISGRNCVMFPLLDHSLIAVNFRSAHAERSCAYCICKQKLRENFNRFLFLLDEAVRICSANMTSPTKQF